MIQQNLSHVYKKYTKAINYDLITAVKFSADCQKKTFWNYFLESLNDSTLCRVFESASILSGPVILVLT